MSSRQYRRTLVFALLLSTGALSLPRADAAPARSGPHRAGPAAQENFFNSDLLAALKNFFGILKDGPAVPADEHDPHPPGNKEGPGACPHGHM
jgi:hypothetical protein